MSELEQLQTTIETRIAQFDPEVELIALERPAGETLRLYIDRPGGVDLELCERVTGELRDLLERYALEVSSPGPRRPLTKPDHFRRYVGRRVRTRARGEHDGHTSFTGELLGATDDGVTVAADTGVVSIAYADIHRSNLLGD